MTVFYVYADFLNSLSDGAAAHFKNNASILNLVHHRRDFNLDGCWTFTVTGHGKAARDSIGAVLKSTARRATLSKNILLSTAKDFYEFSLRHQSEIANNSNKQNPGIHVFFLDSAEVEEIIFSLIVLLLLLFILSPVTDRSKVTADKKIKIKTLLEIGLCQRQVARDSNVSQTCVAHVSKKLKQNLPLSNSIGQGRKKASTQDNDRQLSYIMKKDRTKSSQMLAAEWTLSNGKKLCALTVRRRLISMGYKSYTAKRKLLRTPAQIKKRLTFDKYHQYWSNEWNNVIWSGEAHFEVFNRKNRTLVRRLKLENNELFNFVSRVKGGGATVSV
ncbi:unnamed protein product [Rotaria socialis]